MSWCHVSSEATSEYPKCVVYIRATATEAHVLNDPQCILSIAMGLLIRGWWPTVGPCLHFIETAFWFEPFSVQGKFKCFKSFVLVSCVVWEEFELPQCKVYIQHKRQTLTLRPPMLRIASIFPSHFVSECFSMQTWYLRVMLICLRNGLMLYTSRIVLSKRRSITSEDRQCVVCLQREQQQYLCMIWKLLHWQHQAKPLLTHEANGTPED